MVKRILAALALALGAASASTAQEIMSADAARDAVVAGEVVMIDIRTPQEWRHTGLADIAQPLDMRRRSISQSADDADRPVSDPQTRCNGAGRSFQSGHSQS